MPTQPIIPDAQHQAVIARLIAALHEVALCETWLELQTEDGDHRTYANAAHERALQIARAE